MHRPRRPAAPGQRAAGQGSGSGVHAGQDPEHGARGHGQGPEGLFPARADEGHPPRAWRIGQRGRGTGGPDQAVAPPGLHAPRLVRGHRGAHLPGMAGGTAVGQTFARPAGHQQGQGHPGRGPPRPRQGQGPHPGIPQRAQAEPQVQGAHPVLRGASRRGQDLAGPVHRPGHGPQVPAHLAGRHARRGGNPRPPAHLHRRHAGAHRAEPEATGHAQPRADAG